MKEIKKIQCRCSKTGEEFSLELQVDSTGGQYGLVSLSGLVTATHTVYLYDGFKLFTGFFKEIEAEWKGWSGAKTMENIENELALSATHDGRGAVHLTVTLSDSGQRTFYKVWDVKYTLILDGGAPVSFS